MSVFHLTFSESTETELNHGSVVDDLSMNISVMNRLLKMTHQHQVSSQKPFIMKSQMVDIVQNRLSSDALRFIFCVDEFTVFIHQLLSVRDAAGLRRVTVVDVLVTDSKIFLQKYDEKTKQWRLQKTRDWAIDGNLEMHI